MQIPDEQIRTDEVRHWKGLHLLHFQGSSCSQKVRILLGQKGIPWESHPVDLAREAHITPWFLGINPRGVVPVLVHDGGVHVESNDIMEFLDDQIPSRIEPYFPQSEEERRIVRESLDLEDSLHMELRTITMGFVVPGAAVKKSDETLDAWEKDGAADPQRAREVAWWRRFAEVGIPDDDARAAAEAFRKAFDQLEIRLQANPWLLGDRISVLEIAWFISVHRLALAGYPLERHPKLEALYRKLKVSPGFSTESADPGVLGVVLRAYRSFRRVRGTSLRDVMAAG